MTACSYHHADGWEASSGVNDNVANSYEYSLVLGKRAAPKTGYVPSIKAKP